MCPRSGVIRMASEGIGGICNNIPTVTVSNFVQLCRVQKPIHNNHICHAFLGPSWDDSQVGCTLSIPQDLQGSDR